MDSLNAELNKISSTSDVDPNESYKDCVLMNAMNPDNALGSGVYSEPVGAKANTADTIELDTSMCNTLNSSNMGACATELDEYSISSVSTNDTTHTPETNKCLADCDSVQGYDTPDTSESGENLTDNEASNDAPDTTESDEGEFNDEGLSTEKIVEDIFRIITELTEYTYTEKELNGYDLMAIELERRVMEQKGLFTKKIMATNKEIVRERYVKTVNWEEYNQSIDVLNKFEHLENSANEVFVNAHEMKNTKTVKILLDNKHLHQEILAGFEKIDEGNAEIQRQLDKLNQINIPGILETMKTFEDLGLLSELLIYKLKNIGQDLARLALEITDQIKRMGVQLKEINRTVKEFNENRSVNGKKIGTVVIYINCRNDVTSDIIKTIRKKSQPAIADKQRENTICRSEHKTPHCGKCGWQKSWIKVFKKRGIHIKETTVTNNIHAWVNTINA